MARTGLALLLLMVPILAQAQDSTGGADLHEELVPSPAIAVLVYHPFPDSSDPLGVEYLNSSTDAYWARFSRLDTDGVAGFDFPHTVFDGVVAIEGIPAGEGPYVATQQAYEAAFESRAATEAPLEMSISSGVRGLPGTEIEEEAVYVHIGTQNKTDLQGEDLFLWAAIIEDPVHYEPPQALSNGVSIHPFVVRAIANLGPFEDAPQSIPFPIVGGDGPKAWNLEHLGAVAWVQQGPVDGLRFQAHEIVQAVMESPSAASNSNTVQATSKVVLMEMYSATWCDTCLFGDLVAEELAEAHGVSRVELDTKTGYLKEGPWGLAVLGGVAGIVAVAMMVRREKSK